MKLPALVWLAYLLPSFVFAGEKGLTGFPANIYDPYCATACLRSFNTLTLDCSSEGVTVGMVTFATSTGCYAINTAFLTSVAWCAHTKCADYEVSASLMEYWWDMQITGQKAAGVNAVPAKWTYGEALAQVTKEPALQLSAADTTLNITALVAPSVYQKQYNVLYGVQREGTVENGYGIAILVTGFGTPIVLTWLGYFPFVSTIIHKLRPYLLWPSTIGTYHVRPLPYLLGNVPTIGQSLYIAAFVILNIILTGVNYQSRQPNAWYTTRGREIFSFVMYRTGNFAYIMAPLVFLFAGRNNVLLWLTNWSHSTFILLHRWVARVFTLQALLHSVLALALYREEGMYSMEHSKPYWIWGIVATVCTVILAFFSGLYVRSFFYEAWLIAHVVFPIILVAACWYHAYDLYAYLGGYCYWLYAVSAVWAFDRCARIARILMFGPRHATVTAVGDGDDYVRIDIPGVRWGTDPGKHAYFYFPTLNPLRPWENHPFSVLPTVLLHSSSQRGTSDSVSLGEQSSSDQAERHIDMEKRNCVVPQVKETQRPRHPVGLTLYVRKSNGMTKALGTHRNLLTLVEGPYPNNSTAQVLNCDRLLLIGGGIGITALVPFISRHWNLKLYWSVKESAKCLVYELNDVLRELADKEVSIGKRLDIGTQLAREIDAGWSKVGVVVSGPPMLCDDVRAAVSAAAKRSTHTAFELEVEAYSW